jgi:hypothetical protein
MKRGIERGTKMLRRIIHVVMLLSAACVINPTYAQMRVTRYQADPSDKVFRLVAPDQTVVAADGRTRRFYIQNSAGRSIEITFDQALASVEPNATKRAALKKKFEAALADHRLANYSRIREIKSGPGPCQPTPKGCPMPQVAPQSDNGEDGDEDPTNLDGITVYGDLPTNAWAYTGTGDVAIGGSYWSEDHSAYQNPYDEGSSRALEYQQCWAKDYADFQAQQQGACHNAQIGSAAVVGAGLVAGAACGSAAATVGATAMACGGSVILLVASIADTISSLNQCLAVYPGPPADC